MGSELVRRFKNGTWAWGDYLHQRATLTTSEWRKQFQASFEFQDKHVGETCVIIGNGPSLRETPLELLQRFPTFGLNRINLFWETTGFVPTYHVCVNALVIEQSLPEMVSMPSPNFISWRGLSPSQLAAREDVFPLLSRPGLGFSDDLTRGVHEGHTVTFVALQLAYIFGFSRAILVGVDHRFSPQHNGEPNAAVVSQAPDVSHFDPRYFGPGYRWQLPDLAASERSYVAARQAFNEAGRSVLDATVHGQLQVFPKIDLRHLLA